MKTPNGLEVTAVAMKTPNGTEVTVYSWPVTDDNGDPIILTAEEGFWWSGPSEKDLELIEE